MNHSIHSADRSTHLKIVVVALVAGIAVAAFGISARTGADYSQTAQVVKAGKAGSRDVTYRIVRHNGSVFSRVVLHQTLLTAPVPAN